MGEVESEAFDADDSLVRVRVSNRVRQGLGLLTLDFYPNPNPNPDPNDRPSCTSAARAST